MPRRFALRSSTLATLATLAALALLAGCEQNRVAAPQDAKALVEQYCVGCHNDAEFAGDRPLERIDFEHVGAHADVLERVVRKLKVRTMPPQDEPRARVAIVRVARRELAALLRGGAGVTVSAEPKISAEPKP